MSIYEPWLPRFNLDLAANVANAKTRPAPNRGPRELETLPH